MHARWEVMLMHLRSSKAPLRRLALASGLGLAISLSAVGCSGTSAQGQTTSGRGGRGAGRGAAQPVVTTKVSQKDVPVDIAAVGNVEPYVSISVRSQVTGQLQQAFFHEGDVVKKGDKLFEIDSRPLEAALAQAQATLVRDEALLNQAEAQLNRDKANAEYQQLASERQARLVSAGLLSKDSGDQSRASAEATEALVKSDQANVESAKATLTVQRAAVENAKVQLSYTVIRSPIDGRTGNNTLKVGNLATANNAELVTIDEIQPVYVTFAVPAVHLSAIKAHMNGHEPLTVFAAAPDAGGEPIEGKLTFIDNAVDPTTDTIKLKATFPNSDLRLWPGQFSRVTLRLATLVNATVVPSQAVQTGQDGQFVFLVTPDSTVEQRPVTIAQRMGEDVVIQKGLQPGDTIVTEGQLRLEAGTRVQPQDNSNPTAAGAPGDSAGRGRGARGNGRGGQGQQPQQNQQAH
jgi:membrane fusion protein, multidrug efflux system